MDLVKKITKDVQLKEVKRVKKEWIVRWVRYNP